MEIGITSFAFRHTLDILRKERSVGKTAAWIIQKTVSLNCDKIQLCENIIRPGDVSEKTAGYIRSQVETLNPNLKLELGIKGWTGEDFKEAIIAANRIRADRIRVILNPPPSKSHPSPKLDRSNDLLPEAIGNLLDIAVNLEEAGLSMVVENHFSYHPRQLVRMMDSLPRALFGICYDPLNSIAHFVSPLETLRLLKKYIVVCHIKDAAIRRENTGFYIYGVPLGLGIVPIKDIIAELRQDTNCDSLYLESWLDKYPDNNTTSKAEASMAMSGIQCIREFL